MLNNGHYFDPSILREYDIRGIVGRSLSPADALALGRSMGTIAAGNCGRIAVVGYDGRITSPVLEEELCRGLASCGLYVLRIGLVPTPCVYFAAKTLNAAVGIMITGSHNPPEYNGFKIILDNAPFYGDDIRNLQDLANKGSWAKGNGCIIDVDCLESYVMRMVDDYNSNNGLKVAWDAGNGVAGPAMMMVAGNIPGEHIMMNEEIDGSFPAHHPDPTVEENLQQLKDVILSEKCDLGVAFDGDGDRIGVVDDKGRVIWGDQLLAIYAREVLQKHQGAHILADVKASQILFDEVERLGGIPIMCPTGHSIIKSKMAEYDAPLAGEMSGHIFFADHYFGYDDAIYAAIRLINYLADSGKKLSDLCDELPQMVNTPEIRIEVPEIRKFEIIEEIKARLDATDAVVNKIDGVRVLQDEGWWLIRASNTQNALVLRCEASNKNDLDILCARVLEELQASEINMTSIFEN